MNEIQKLVNFIDEKQGQDIKVLDMRQVTPYMDFMIVTHFSNPRLLGATADYLLEYLDQNGLNYRPLDRSDKSGWVLVDAGHIIIHLFLEEERNLYQLEKLWKDTLVSHESLERL